MCWNRASKYAELERGSQGKHRTISFVFQYPLDSAATEQHNYVRTNIMTKVIYDWSHIHDTCGSRISGAQADQPSGQGGKECPLPAHKQYPRTNPKTVSLILGNRLNLPGNLSEFETLLL